MGTASATPASFIFILIFFRWSIGPGLLEGVELSMETFPVGAGGVLIVFVKIMIK